MRMDVKSIYDHLTHKRYKVEDGHICFEGEEGIGDFALHKMIEIARAVTIYKKTGVCNLCNGSGKYAILEEVEVKCPLCSKNAQDKELNQKEIAD